MHHFYIRFIAFILFYVITGWNISVEQITLDLRCFAFHHQYLHFIELHLEKHLRSISNEITSTSFLISSSPTLTWSTSSSSSSLTLTWSSSLTLASSSSLTLTWWWSSLALTWWWSSLALASWWWSSLTWW